MDGFDWDEANRGHIGRHGVSVEEVEQACSGFMLSLDSSFMDGEARYEDIGATTSGRILKIVTTGRDGLIRVVTAYDAPLWTKRTYLAAMVKRYE